MQAFESSSIAPSFAKKEKMKGSLIAALVLVLLVCNTCIVYASISDASDAESAQSDVEVQENDRNSKDTSIEGRDILRISGQAYASDMNPKFSETYPHVDVEFLMNNGNTVDQLILDMTTGDASADIYVLYGSSGLLEAAIRKGIALDLSGSKVLSDFSKKTAFYIKQKVTDDDRIFAIPYSIHCRQLFGFNEEIGKKLAITRPKSLIELSHIYSEWGRNDGTDGYFLTSRSLSNVFGSFLVYGIDSYIAEYSDGDYVSFDTEDFRKYILELEKFRDSFTFLNEEHSGWKEHLYDRALFIEEYPLLKTQEDIRVNFSELVPFALSLDETGSPVIPVDMSVFVVNTASDNREIALKYLECLVENYPEEMKIIVSEEMSEPVEFENYRENLHYYQNEKSNIEKLLQEPNSDDNRLHLNEERARIDAIIEEIEGNRWKITQGDIANFKAIQPFMRIMPRISYEYYDAIPATKLLFHKFVLGEIDAGMFVSQLSQIQRLINEENR